MNGDMQGGQSGGAAFLKAEVITFGWRTWYGNAGFFVLLLLISGIIGGSLPQLLEISAVRESALNQFLVQLTFFVLNMIMQMGLVRIALRFCDGERAAFSDLFACAPLFFKYLLALILYWAIVCVGLLLFIVPGIIWAIQFQFFVYHIVEKGMGPLEALSASSAITRGSKGNLFLLGLLLFLVNVAGFLCLVVGLFASIPVTMLAMACVYRKLSGGCCVLPSARKGEPPPGLTGSQMPNSLS